MNYPLPSDYVDSIKFAEDNFASLTNLHPIFDKDDNPIYKNEGDCIIFQMKDVITDKEYYIKCFLAEKLDRIEWYNEILHSNLFFSKESHFIENELYVDTDVSDKEEFPIFIYPWTESVCLIDYIQANIKNKLILNHLSFQFGNILNGHEIAISFGTNWILRKLQ